MPKSVKYPIFNSDSFHGFPADFVASLSQVLQEPEPASYEQALKDPRWVHAMNQELEALERNHTWDLTMLPKGKKVVTYKWIYKTKFNSDGTVERLKGRLVIRRFNQ